MATNSVLIPDSLASFPKFTGGFSLPSLGNQSFFRQSISTEITCQNRRDLAEALGIHPTWITTPRLIHSGIVKIAEKKDRGRGGLTPMPHFGECDGIITQTSNLFPLVTAADCLPILFWEPLLPVWGAVHAGRRGLERGILSNTVKAFLSLGVEIEHLHVVIGPSIHSCCYEVDQKTMEFFCSKRGSAFAEKRQDRYFLDLPGSAIHELLENKIPEKNIEWISHCTFCHPQKYFSARRDGPFFQTFAAIIGVKENE